MLSRETAYHGRVIELSVETLRLPGGREVRREIVGHPDCVCAAAFLEDGRMVLVHQYRRPVGRLIWEVPAGKIDPGEDPAEAMRRELIEECGVQATDLEEVAVFYPSPGICTERMHVFVARRCTTGATHAAEDEIVGWDAFPLDEARAMVARGEIVDAKSMLAILLVSGDAPAA